MKKEKFSPFEAADYLRTEADIAAYLDEAMEDGDPKVLVAAMGDVVRARNVSQVARATGLTREGIYKAFSASGNPSFATVLSVAKALDLVLAFHARKAAHSPRGARKRAAAAKASHSRSPSNGRKDTALSRR